MPDVTDSMAQPSSDQSPKPSAIEYEIAMYQNNSYIPSRVSSQKTQRGFVPFFEEIYQVSVNNYH